MTTKIIGVKHDPHKIVSLLPRLLEEIDSQIAGIESKRVKVGIESTRKYFERSWLWKNVVEHIKKNPRVEVAFLDSTIATKIAYEYEYLAKRIKYSFKYGYEITKEELNKFDKMEYVIVELRDRQMQKAIEKKQTDLNILGNIHAYTIGKKLKVKPTYVGTTAFDAELSADLLKAGHRNIEKQIKRKQRKRKLSRLLTRIGIRKNKPL